MRPVRIYKDNIREHILRSLIFTDLAVIVVGTIIIAAASFIFYKYTIHHFDTGLFIATVVILEIIFMLIITMKIDNQPLVKVFPRAVKKLFSKSEQRYAQLEPYFKDFSIQDDTVVRPKAVLRIFAVEPFDIALLNSDERSAFYRNIKQVIHVIPAQIQIIVRRETAKPSDYSPHFLSLYRTSDKNRADLINRYIDGFTWLINKGTFLTVRYYLVISAYANTKNTKEYLLGLTKLDDHEHRILAAFTQCNIKARQLRTEELIQFYQAQLR